MNGKLHVYTGNGKGKTTAALGLALRSVGADKQVFIGQFVKGMHYSELDAIKELKDKIVLKQYGRDCFIYQEPAKEDIEAARHGLAEVAEVLKSNDFQLVILDEATIAIHYNLFSIDELLKVLDQRNPDLEVVITGRYADKRLVELADLVTEMVEVKHYYQTGVEARKGVEM